jgi:glycosyltransferase 2 family protein
MVNKIRNIYYLTAISGLLVFGATALLAVSSELSMLEQRVFEVFFNLPLALHPFVLALTQLGSIWALVFVVLFAYIFNRRHLAANFALAGGATYISVVLAKELIGRPRPVYFLPDIVQRDLFAVGLGFPSGHTAMATALSLTLLAFLPRKYYIIVPLWILAVGFSRLYLGVHAPLDIIGGFGLGAAMFAITRLMWKKT